MKPFDNQIIYTLTNLSARNGLKFFFYIFNCYKTLQADLKSLDYNKLKAPFDGLYKVAAAQENH